MAQMVKKLPAMQETWVWSLGWQDPLQKGKATHSSTLAWKIPQTEEPGGYEFQSSYASFHKVLGVREELFSSKKGTNSFNPSS